MLISSKQSFGMGGGASSLLNEALFHFDGIDNGGNGVHLQKTRIWKNLGNAGSEYDAVRRGNDDSTISKWGLNHAAFDSRTDVKQYFTVGGLENVDVLPMLRDEYSFVVTFAVANGWRANYSGLLGSHIRWGDGVHVGFNVMQYNNYTNIFDIASTSTSISDSLRVHQTIASSSIANGEIYCACASITTSRRAVFCNGELLGENTVQTDAKYITFNGNPFTIGSSYIDNTVISTDRTFVGNIYNVAAFDRALTDDECAKISEYCLSRFK